MAPVGKVADDMKVGLASVVIADLGSEELPEAFRSRWRGRKQRRKRGAGGQVRFPSFL